jgi:hypothetical protein
MRDSKGKFTRKTVGDSGETPISEAKSQITQDLNWLSLLIYLAVRILPLIIMIWLILRYLRVYSKVIELFVELGCGENCSCVCTPTATPAGKPGKSGDI